MHEDFDNVQLDSTFGEGPQIDLGDITDLIKDASIVDLSWLQEPVTFQHSNSIVPSNKELEYNWGDTTDNLYGAFKLVKGNPSVREQIKKKSLWDHSEEMADNIYHWSSPSVSKVSSTRDIVSSVQFIKRLIHRGYTGENLNLEAQKYMPQDEWLKAASNRQAARSEEGVLGNVYVDVTSFDSCYKAKEVTDKYNKLAKFVLKTSACGGCSFNSQGRCSLVSKKIASKEEIFNDVNTKQYLDYLSSVKRIDTDFVTKNASLSNLEKLQKAFLSRIASVKRVGGVKAKLPAPLDKKANFNSAPFVRVASKYMAKGYSVDFLRGKIAEKVPNQSLDGIFKEAASSLPELSTDVAACNSEVLKQAKLLSRGAKCSGCAYDMSSHCGVSKTAFSSPKVKAQREISATFASLPIVESRNTTGLVKKASRALEQGHSFARVLKAAGKVVGTKEASRVLDQAMVQSKGISATQFTDCQEPAFRLAASLKKSGKCEGCSFNKGLSCGLTRKAFVTEEAFDASSVSDHHLYGSFYKDLTLDRMISVDSNTNLPSLEVEELDQFNL